MLRTQIPLDKLDIQIMKPWWEWMLLAAGTLETGKHNAMTIAWGSIGVMWGQPFMQVVVRPTRHTYRFMEEGDSFTTSVFGAEHKDALSLLGSVSGRDRDKIREAGLTPIASQTVSAISFAEAELVFECRKIYHHDFDPGRFLADYIAKQYDKDYHRSYFGEITGVYGTAKYRAEQ